MFFSMIRTVAVLTPHGLGCRIESSNRYNAEPRWTKPPYESSVCQALWYPKQEGQRKPKQLRSVMQGRSSKHLAYTIWHHPYFPRLLGRCWAHECSSAQPADSRNVQANNPDPKLGIFELFTNMNFASWFNICSELFTKMWWKQPSSTKFYRFRRSKATKNPPPFHSPVQSLFSIPPCPKKNIGRFHHKVPMFFIRFRWKRKKSFQFQHLVNWLYGWSTNPPPTNVSPAQKLRP